MTTKISIWDNGGSTLYRLTVLIYEDDKCLKGSVYGMSENALGFNQYCGEFPSEYKSLAHCGKKLREIPNKEIDKAILNRLEENQCKNLEIV
jgi:hypothetical protein